MGGGGGGGGTMCPISLVGRGLMLPRLDTLLSHPQVVTGNVRTNSRRMVRQGSSSVDITFKASVGV